MVKRNKFLSVIVMGILYGCGGGTSGNNGVYTCPYPVFNQQIAEQLLTNWGNGLQQYSLANNPDIYTSAGFFTMTFYSPDAVLQPTVSPVQRDGTQEIYNYFIEFLSKNPILSFNPESNDAADLGCGFGAYAGYYNFIVYPGTSGESTVHARFSFLYEYRQPQFQESFVAESGPQSGQRFMQTNQSGWYILGQHSSVLPGNE